MVRLFSHGMAIAVVANFSMASSASAQASMHSKASAVELGVELDEAKIRKMIVGRLVAPIDRKGKATFYGSAFYKDGKYKSLSDWPSETGTYSIKGKIITINTRSNKKTKSIIVDKSGNYYFKNFLYGRADYTLIGFFDLKEYEK